MIHKPWVSAAGGSNLRGSGRDNRLLRVPRSWQGAGAGGVGRRAPSSNSPQTSTARSGSDIHHRPWKRRGVRRCCPPRGDQAVDSARLEGRPIRQARRRELGFKGETPPSHSERCARPALPVAARCDDGAPCLRGSSPTSRSSTCWPALRLVPAREGRAGAACRAAAKAGEAAPAARGTAAITDSLSSARRTRARAILELLLEARRRPGFPSRSGGEVDGPWDRRGSAASRPRGRPMWRSRRAARPGQAEASRKALLPAVHGRCGVGRRRVQLRPARSAR